MARCVVSWRFKEVIIVCFNRMGGQISAPQRAKDEQLDMYGPFALRQSQKYRLNIFSDLLTMLVRDTGNNLFNLSKVLNSQSSCESLITVIADKLNKEFTTLRFPDPKRGTESSLVGFITEDNYKTKFKNDPIRQIYCSKFAFFIVRFTALLAALVASVAYQKNLYLQDDTVKVEMPTVNPTYKNLVDESISGNNIPAEVVNYLVSRGIMRKIANDTRNLYYFGNMDSVVLDTDKGIVYNARNLTDTGVLRISIDRAPLGNITARPSSSSMGTQTNLPAPFSAPAASAPFAAPAAPAPFAAPVAPAAAAAAPPRAPQFGKNQAVFNPSAVNYANNASLGRHSNAPSFNSKGSGNYGVTAPILGKTRKGRKAGRSTRKRHRGGAVLFRISLAGVVNCSTTGTCDVAQFDMDENGNTYPLNNTTSSQPFAYRVSPYLSQQATKIKLESPVERAAMPPDKFTSFGKMDSKAYSFMKYYERAIRGDSGAKEITSPAFYRAFLLASSSNEKQVDTLFCTDHWKGIMTATIPYALLQFLYYDLNGGNKSPAAAEELTQVASKFLSNDIARPYVPSGVAVTEFSQLAFVEPKTLASAFCANLTTGKRTTYVEDQQKVLKNAHQKLRRMYDDQMEAIEKLMFKMLRLKNMGLQGGLQLRLTDVFVTDPAGAEVVLDRFVKEGRELLANHYLNVESVYKTAIKEFTQVSRGEIPRSVTAAPVAPRTNTKNNAPKNPIEFGDQTLHQNAYKSS